MDNVLLGMVTGAGILMFTNPIWVAKTRLCLQYENERSKYRGLLDCLFTVARTEGITALYRVCTSLLFLLLTSQISSLQSIIKRKDLFLRRYIVKQAPLNVKI